MRLATVDGVGPLTNDRCHCTATPEPLVTGQPQPTRQRQLPKLMTSVQGPADPAVTDD